MTETFMTFETQVAEDACIDLIGAEPSSNGNTTNKNEKGEEANSDQHNFDSNDEDEDKNSQEFEGLQSSTKEPDNESGQNGPYLVSLCGLPYSANCEDVMEFLEDCGILGDHKGIHIANGPDSRPNGIAFVELASNQDVEKAKEKHKKNMGKRYIEVRQITENDMQRMLDRWKPRREPVNAVVLLKGLPYSCTTDDIREFFKDLEIEPNGVLIVLDERGRVCGDGFVHFASLRSVDSALQKHKEKIKHRYIEVYRSDLREMYPRVTNQLSPPGSVGGSWMDRGRDDESGYRRGSDDRGFGGGPARTRYDRSSYRSDNGDRRKYGGPYDRSSPRSYRRHDSPSSHRGSDRSHKEFVPPYRSRTGHSVHMRGLPYSVTKEQIIEFFGPVVPVDVTIEMLRDGKKTGNANVDFATEEDVREALRKDREKIDTRYIELYNNKF